MLIPALEKDADDRTDYLLENMQILSPKKQEITNLQQFLIESLGYKNKLKMVNRYLSDPNFIAYTSLDTIIYYLAVTNKDFLYRYLQASHTHTLDDLLTLIVNHRKNFEDPVSLLKLLLARPDYRFCLSDLCRPLLSLFLENEADCIKVILSHPKIFKLFKQYYDLHGEGQVSKEDHGSLMPMVTAWYVTHQSNYLELFSAFSKENQVQLLEGFVPAFIDPERPKLKNYAIRHGKIELLNVIGGISSRLIKMDFLAKPIVRAPQIWRNDRVLTRWRRCQQDFAFNFANKRIVKLYLATELNETKALAKRTADQYEIPGLILNHHTALDTLEKILNENKLRIPQHVQKHLLTGTATKGLVESGNVGNHEGAKRMVFLFFTRLRDLNDKDTPLKDSETIKPRLVFNTEQLLIENPHINTLVIGPYSLFEGERTVILPSGTKIVSTPNLFHESINMRIIKLNSGERSLKTIYQKLFEIVFEMFVLKLEQHDKEDVIKRLTEPSSPEDQQLAQRFINLLYLEWLIPYDVKLRFSYLDIIDYGDETYNFADLRQVANQADESTVLTAIENFKNLELFPFAIYGLLKIALIRGHQKVIKNLYQFKTNHNDIIYYPRETYEIESIAQLILEDFNNERVFVVFENNKLTIHSSQKKNSNRDGSHHAEMSKLHYAVGKKDVVNKNAINLLLPETLTLEIGTNKDFASLEELRDALLTYEVTSLLVSQLNQIYYSQTNGQFHPITGKGATSAGVALLANRLFGGETAYRIKIKCDSTEQKIYIHTDAATQLNFICDALINALDIPANLITVTDQNCILDMTPATLIAKLRCGATCYEGINIMDDNGYFYLANRHGRGLASAGGHHSDKYAPESISHGLKSEFGLVFKNPAQAEQHITILPNVKTIQKTKIYVVPASELKLSEPAGKSNLPFHADPDEFEPGSETLLKLSQMRGIGFYDVMPIAELGQYQLGLLKDYIKENFAEGYESMTFKIDDTIDTVLKSVTYKIPGERFGQIEISVKGILPQVLENVFNDLCERTTISSEDSSKTYIFDVLSPLELIKAIKEYSPALSTYSKP